MRPGFLLQELADRLADELVRVEQDNPQENDALYAGGRVRMAHNAGRLPDPGDEQDEQPGESSDESLRGDRPDGTPQPPDNGGQPHPFDVLPPRCWRMRPPGFAPLPARYVLPGDGPGRAKRFVAMSELPRDWQRPSCHEANEAARRRLGLPAGAGVESHVALALPDTEPCRSYMRLHQACVDSMENLRQGSGRLCLLVLHNRVDFAREFGVRAFIQACRGVDAPSGPPLCLLHVFTPQVQPARGKGAGR